LIAVLAVASLAAYAQPRAIGANLGGSLGFSYQHGFGEANMLDVAVSVPFLNGWGIGGSVTYDWIDPFNAPVPWNEKGEWHWYMGVGGGGGIYGFKEPCWFAGVVGHIGIEYDFWFPLQLSLDWRPNIGVSNAHKNWFNPWGLYDGISLGIRYKF
jgi:hypothetical protein